MSGSGARHAALLLAALLLPGAALADPCADWGGLAEGPTVAGLMNGDLGRAHRVCGRTEAGLTAGAYLLAEPDDFYGHIVGGATLDGSLAASETVEVFGSLEALRYDSVLAPFPEAYVGPGFTTLGAAWRAHTGEASALGLNGKIVLPTTGLYDNAWPVALDLGVAGLLAPGERLRLHGQLSGLLTAAISGGPAAPAAGVAPTVGVEWRPTGGFALVADVVGSFGLTAPVDHVAVAPGVRLGSGRFGFQLDATVPLAGRERALATVDARFALRFD